MRSSEVASCYFLSTGLMKPSLAVPASIVQSLYWGVQDEALGLLGSSTAGGTELSSVLSFYQQSC
jgi:hypothetical protein